jgi:hypothetical protein
LFAGRRGSCGVMIDRRRVWHLDPAAMPPPPGMCDAAINSSQEKDHRFCSPRSEVPPPALRACGTSLVGGHKTTTQFGGTCETPLGESELDVAYARFIEQGGLNAPPPTTTTARA